MSNYPDTENNSPTQSSSSSKTFSHSAPFDTLREYVEALEERGLLMRFKRLDQDAYEMTALMYRFVDQYGWNEAPAILAEEVKINGKWIRGPVIANHQGHLDTEAVTFGVEPIPKEPVATYRKAMTFLAVGRPCMSYAARSKTSSPLIRLYLRTMSFIELFQA